MWKDWSNLGLGSWMAISPWLLGPNASNDSVIVAGCLGAGVLIAALAFWTAVKKRSWPEVPVFLLGTWLLVAPAVWQYDSVAMTWNNFAVGLLVISLASWRRAELERVT